MESMFSEPTPHGIDQLALVLYARGPLFKSLAKFVFIYSFLHPFPHSPMHQEARDNSNILTAGWPVVQSSFYCSKQCQPPGTWRNCFLGFEVAP